MITLQNNNLTKLIHTRGNTKWFFSKKKEKRSDLNLEQRKEQQNLRFYLRLCWIWFGSKLIYHCLEEWF